MNVSRYLAEAYLTESQDHKLTPTLRKELESLGFRELNDGSFMLNPTTKMADVITVEKEGTGLLVRWSVKNKHDYKEITTDEVSEFVKSIISKFGSSKVPSKIQEAVEAISYKDIDSKEKLSTYIDSLNDAGVSDTKQKELLIKVCYNILKGK